VSGTLKVVIIDFQGMVDYAKKAAWPERVNRRN
jgi:hypothetical protein